jgi:hypothetical protein
MRERDSIDRRPKVRRDGWTAERQLRFLDALGRTRSVTRAARAAGMSRESAYRLRRRREAALFAAAWDQALRSMPIKVHEVSARGRVGRRLRSAGFRANPPKVTKLAKFVTPRFDSFEKELRDLLDLGRGLD